MNKTEAKMENNTEQQSSSDPKSNTTDDCCICLGKIPQLRGTLVCVSRKF